jgi:hypothetical protein
MDFDMKFIFGLVIILKLNYYYIKRVTNKGVML